MFSICHTRWPYKSVGAWSSPKFYCSNVTRVFNFVLVERYSIFFFLFPFNLILIPPVFDDLNPKFYYFNLRDSIYAMCQEIFYSTMTTCRVVSWPFPRYDLKDEKEFSPLFFLYSLRILLSICIAILNFVAFFRCFTIYCLLKKDLETFEKFKFRMIKWLWIWLIKKKVTMNDLKSKLKSNE